MAKLNTTEWIVGSYYSSTEEFIEDVCIVNISQTDDGRISMGLIPYGAPFSKQGATLDSKHIMLKIDIPKEIENAYIESLTGLVVGPTKNAGLTLV
jgi:hypothetical protein